MARLSLLIVHCKNEVSLRVPSQPVVVRILLRTGLLQTIFMITPEFFVASIAFLVVQNCQNAPLALIFFVVYQCFPEEIRWDSLQQGLYFSVCQFNNLLVCMVSETYR